MRLQQFRKRYEEVKHHNRGQNTFYQMEINKFSDLVSHGDKFTKLKSKKRQIW